MGKGDKKTRKGKTYSGSYGNIRPHVIKTDAAAKTVSKTAVKKVAPVAKKPAAKKPAA
jgi:30S ribosomal protein S31